MQRIIGSLLFFPNQLRVQDMKSDFLDIITASCGTFNQR